MSASTTAAEPTAAQSKSQGPQRPDVTAYETRAAVASQTAARRRPNGSNKPFPLKSGALATNSVRATTEFRELMEEPPGGVNAGRASSAKPHVEGRHVALGVDDVQAHDFVLSGGFSVVDTRYGSTWGTSKHGARDAGMTAHRGTLRGDEHVDSAALLAAVEAAFGFTADEVRSVYRQGRLSTEQGELRARIDARLLALSRAGAQVHRLGEALGLRMRPSPEGGDRCEAVSNALARAKAAELPTEGRA